MKFQTNRHFAFSPQAVFEAIADGQKLARWWGPNGFTNSFEEFDFTIGGCWKFIMHGPDGTDYPNENEFTEIERDKRVVIRHRSAPHFNLNIELTEIAGGTDLQWTQIFDDPKFGDSVAHIVVPANEQNLDRLLLVLEENE